jgi:hypothetical protein
LAGALHAAPLPSVHGQFLSPEIRVLLIRHSGQGGDSWRDPESSNFKSATRENRLTTKAQRGWRRNQISEYLPQSMS